MVSSQTVLRLFSFSSGSEAEPRLLQQADPRTHQTGLTRNAIATLLRPSERHPLLRAHAHHQAEDQAAQGRAHPAVARRGHVHLSERAVHVSAALAHARTAATARGARQADDARTQQGRGLREGVRVLPHHAVGQAQATNPRDGAVQRTTLHTLNNQCRKPTAIYFVTKVTSRRTVSNFIGKKYYRYTYMYNHD